MEPVLAGVWRQGLLKFTFEQSLFHSYVLYPTRRYGIHGYPLNDHWKPLDGEATKQKYTNPREISMLSDVQ
jgi:hypothetical protein